jgi:hypothetical protein
MVAGVSSSKIREELRAGDVLRFSLAGVQLKFSAVMEASGGLTIPAHGVGGSWIVKMPSTQFATVPEVEFVMLELARAAGLDVPRHDCFRGTPPVMEHLELLSLADNPVCAPLTRLDAKDDNEGVSVDKPSDEPGVDL